MEYCWYEIIHLQSIHLYPPMNTCSPGVKNTLGFMESQNLFLVFPQVFSSCEQVKCYPWGRYDDKMLLLRTKWTSTQIISRVNCLQEGPASFWIALPRQHHP